MDDQPVHEIKQAQSQYAVFKIISNQLKQFMTLALTNLHVY